MKASKFITIFTRRKPANKDVDSNTLAAANSTASNPSGNIQDIIPRGGQGSNIAPIVGTSPIVTSAAMPVPQVSVGQVDPLNGVNPQIAPASPLPAQPARPAEAVDGSLTNVSNQTVAAEYDESLDPPETSDDLLAGGDAQVDDLPPDPEDDAALAGDDTDTPEPDPDPVDDDPAGAAPPPVTTVAAVPAAPAPTGPTTTPDPVAPAAVPVAAVPPPPDPAAPETIAGGLTGGDDQVDDLPPDPVDDVVLPDDDPDPALPDPTDDDPAIAPATGQAPQAAPVAAATPPPSSLGFPANSSYSAASNPAHPPRRHGPPSHHPASGGWTAAGADVPPDPASVSLAAEKVDTDPIKIKSSKHHKRH